MPDQKEFNDRMVYSKDIIEVLKTQHRDLKSFLGNVADDIKKEAPDFINILGRLQKFKTEMTDHADFENCAFYQPLLKKMEGQGFDTADIKEFVAEITNLLNVVNDFIQKYKEVEAIQKNIPVFSSDLSVAISKLETRITAEEEGMFIYW